MSRNPRYETLPTGGPVWASEPFRVFFPLGIAAAVFGLALWPLFYAGWWPVYPALQHPRILIFGFGAAFLLGFLGTAWPRFLESSALNRFEVALLAIGWTAAQFAYATAAIAAGDLFLASTGTCLLIILGRRLFGNESPFPPPGFALAFLAVVLAVSVLFGWGFRLLRSPQLDLLFRLFAYQGFLLLPLLGVGSYLFPRFFQSSKPEGKPPTGRNLSAKRRKITVWGTATAILLSFFVEVWASVAWGNLIRFAAILLWAWGVLPVVFRAGAPGTRPWAVRMGLIMVASGFLLRALMPNQIFAFEHILFLGGFSQLILLVADRVVAGHCMERPPAPKSTKWRWIVWLMILTAATRATADLVPSTKVSHHIYAAIMLIAIFILWFSEIGPRLRSVPQED